MTARRADHPIPLAAGRPCTKILASPRTGVNGAAATGTPTAAHASGARYAPLGEQPVVSGLGS